LKIGWIDYLNTVPFRKAIVNRNGKVIIKGVPSFLNKLIYESKIDIGIVSSAEYIEHFNRYFLFSDVSISSYKKVYSVVLVSDVPMERLEYIYLSKESKTSNLLIEIILRKFLSKDTQIGFDIPSKMKTGFLLIGNKALEEKQKFKYVYDLSDIWFSYTKLPFVFALWCVRREFYYQSLDSVERFKLNLKSSVNEFFKKDIKYLKPDVRNYLQNLDFSLTKEHILSLERFSSYLKELNLIDKMPNFEFV